MERIHRICRRLRHDGWRGEKEEILTFNDYSGEHCETGAILCIPA